MSHTPEPSWPAPGNERPVPASQPDRMALRASDHDRQLVADVLTSAFADGRITRDELDERLQATWSARTFGDLTPLTHDLSGIATTTQYTSPDRAQVVPSQDTPDRSTLVAVLGSRKPAAGSPLARRTNLTSVLGEIKIDLRGTVFSAREYRLDLQSILGSVTIRVPDGVTVRDDTIALLGDSTVVGITPHADDVVLRIKGVVLLGELKVKGPGA